MAVSTARRFVLQLVPFDDFTCSSVSTLPVQANHAGVFRQGVGFDLRACDLLRMICDKWFLKARGLEIALRPMTHAQSSLAPRWIEESSKRTLKEIFFANIVSGSVSIDSGDHCMYYVFFKRGMCDSERGAELYGTRLPLSLRRPALEEVFTRKDRSVFANKASVFLLPEPLELRGV